jgi:hypothetical protein
MAMKKPETVVVIGDLVGSRRSGDRRALHESVSAALSAVNARFGGDLRLTVGDEYQGAFPALGAALRATLALRLELLPEADARHGIAVGAVEELVGPGRIEDGPGWWAARDAIEAVKQSEARAATRRLRTAFRLADGVTGPDPAAVNAALIGRDALVGALSARGLSVLRGLLAGRTQREIAESEGVSTSAISQRVRHDGLGMLVTLDANLGEVR